MNSEDFQAMSENGVPPMQLQARLASDSIDNLSNLDIYSKTNVRLSKIMCSIGPSSRDPEVVFKMIEAGMDIARLHFTKGTYEYHAETIRNIRTAMNKYSKKTGINCTLALAVNTQGPEIRTGALEEGAGTTVELKKGETIKLTTDRAYREKSSGQALYVDYEEIHTCVKVGNHIFLDDGQIVVLCTSIQGSNVLGVIEKGGILENNVTVNLPGVPLELPVLTQKDISDINFGLAQDMDMITASFVRKIRDIDFIKNVIIKAGKVVPIVAKIENQEGLFNLSKIMRVVDGIFIGRGDLSIEMPIEKLFIGQKSVIVKCNKLGKPVMCSTDIFYTMITKPKPTSAEYSDAANAILDGADCISFCNETSKGKYPVECVMKMAAVCKEADAAFRQGRWYANIHEKLKKPIKAQCSICLTAVELANQCLAASIILVTAVKRTERLLARYKPTCPIIFVTRNLPAARESQLFRALYPFFIDGSPLSDHLEEVKICTEYGINYGKALGLIKSGDPVIILSRSSDKIDTINTLHIDYVSDIVDIITV